MTRTIGERIVADGFRLVSGFGLGIGEQVVVGALRALYHQPVASGQDRILIRPFPRASSTAHQAATNSRHREDLLSRVGAVIVVAGNKLDSTGGIKPSDGVMEEVQIAQRMQRVIIPVGVTGHVARDLWEQAVAEPERFFPGLDVGPHLATLGDASAPDDAVIGAVFAILQQAQRVASLRHS